MKMAQFHVNLTCIVSTVHEVEKSYSMYTLFNEVDNDGLSRRDGARPLSLVARLSCQDERVSLNVNVP